MFSKYSIVIGDHNRVVYRLPFELVGSNMFFVPSGDTGIVFDPNENKDLVDLFSIHGTKSVVIVLTHEHYDHTIGTLWLQSIMNTRLFCHRTCAESISTEKGNDPKTLAALLSLRDAVDGGNRRDAFLAIAKRYALRADETFTGQALLRAGDIELHCYSAPGHSPGSAIYMLDERCLFPGDSLIQHTPTLLRLPRSDKSAFENVTRPLLRSFNKELTVFPGHDEPFRLSEAEYL